MAEYIERERLIRNLSEDLEACGEADSCHRPIAYGTILGLRGALSYANTLPAADVVEVVRCKDCKHSCFVKSCSKYECKKGCGTLKYSNDFCSYGAKMDGKGDTK